MKQIFKKFKASIKKDQSLVCKSKHKHTLYNHGPKLRALYQNVILVQSTLYYTYKYKQLSYKKYAYNNSTAVSNSNEGYEGKRSVFKQNGKVS